MTIPTTPLSRHDIALNYLEQIKAHIENNNINDAATQLSGLTEHISQWQRSENLQSARRWLDKALEADLLTFDIGLAREYIALWANATDSDGDNPELNDYRERVAERSKQKNEALMIRGVISHSDEIISQANALEHTPEPPAPTFMMRQYYNKVKDLVRSAQAEYENSPELEQLVQRVERLHSNKETAAMIFPMALESKKYSNALNNLNQLPDDFLIPRFTAIEDAEDAIKLQYQNMVSIPAARGEITTKAKTWANDIAITAIKISQRFLEAHEPQEAVEELTLGDSVEKFLADEQKSELETAQSNATTALRNRERAEERAQKALELVASDPLAAWDEYVGAYQAYQWAEGLEQVRTSTLQAMRSHLNNMAHEADVAFHEARDMERVRQIATRAKTQFANKDASLNDILAQFDEFEDMIRRYQDYITSGNEIIEKVKATIWEDAVTANEFLTQVESYPDFVLQAFDDIYDLRAQVNQRLNADQTYNQLYTSLFNETLPEITQAIERTHVAAEDFAEDNRFPMLEKWLKYHMAFITAVPQFERGAYEQVIQLIAPVLNHPEHPDYDDALKMSQTIQSARQTDAQDTNEESTSSDD